MVQHFNKFHPKFFSREAQQSRTGVKNYQVSILTLMRKKSGLQETGKYFAFYIISFPYICQNQCFLKYFLTWLLRPHRYRANWAAQHHSEFEPWVLIICLRLCPLAHKSIDKCIDTKIWSQSWRQKLLQSNWTEGFRTRQAASHISMLLWSQETIYL